MKKYFFLLFPFLFPISFAAQNSPPLLLIQTIPLPKVEGRIDHLDIDLKGERLFVAALGNNTVEVVDLHAGRKIHSITGLENPQGVCFIPELKRIFVTDEGGSCILFDAQSFKLINSLKLPRDADNIRYSPATKNIYVGYGEGGLAIINSETGQPAGDIKLSGHPESFQLEKAGERIFVNVPTLNQVVVIDRIKKTVVTTWPLTGIQKNFPMALDEEHNRLWVGCRNPARILVLDSNSGKTIASLNCAKDPDDIYYDARLKRIYVSCGEGFVNVYEQENLNQYRMVSEIPTAKGARTSLFAPELRRLYVAVPHFAEQKAEIRVYQIQP